MRPLYRWTLLVAALLFVLVGGYAAMLKSGNDEPASKQAGVYLETPDAPKH